MSRQVPSLPNIESLIDGDGEITLGRAAGFACTATACEEDRPLAMLVRRNGETLDQLLVRLDEAIEKATEENIVTDEVNNAPNLRP